MAGSWGRVTERNEALVTSRRTRTGVGPPKVKEFSIKNVISYQSCTAKAGGEEDNTWAAFTYGGNVESSRAILLSFLALGLHLQTQREREAEVIPMDEEGEAKSSAKSKRKTDFSVFLTKIEKCRLSTLKDA